MSPLMISGWTVQWEDLPMTDVFVLWHISPAPRANVALAENLIRAWRSARISASLSPLLIGSSRSSVNTFVTPR